MIDRKSSRIKAFSRKVYFMICLEHFFLKCIINKNYLRCCDRRKVCGVRLEFITASACWCMWEWTGVRVVGTAYLLSDHFDSKQSTVDLPLTWHPSYGGTDPLGLFPLFLKSTAEVMASRHCVVFRWGCLASFPAWKRAKVAQIQKGPPLSSVANY